MIILLKKSISKLKTFIVLSFVIILFSFNYAFGEQRTSINWGSWKPDNEKDFISEKSVISTGKPAYDKTIIAGIISEVSPIIEKYTERKFKNKVDFNLVETKELELVLRKELQKQLRNFMPESSDETIAQHAKEYSKISKSLLGKYGFLTKTLYFLPYQYKALLQRHQIDEKHHNNILKLVVAHELCHMLQDQEIDVGNKILKIKNQEEMVAFNALLEGHAMFVMNKVGKELNLDNAITEFYKIFSIPESRKSDVELNTANKIIIQQFQLVYLGGEKFVKYHFEEGGNDKIWSIFEKNPQNTYTIANPETYDSEDEITRMDLKQCLDFLNKIYDSKDGWTNRNVELTYFQIDSVYNKFDPDVKKKIMSNIVQNRVFLAEKPDGTLYNITIIILKKDLKGSKFIKYLEDFIKNNVKNNDDENVKLTNFKKEKIKSIKADATSKVTVTFDYNNMVKKDLTAMRICRDELFIEILTMNYETTDEETKSNTDKIFKLYESLKNE